MLLRYATALLTKPKYSISVKDGNDDEKDYKEFKNEFVNQKNKFTQEQKVLKEEYAGKKIDVTTLKNFKTTAVFNDDEGKKLRLSVANPKKAMFMTLFAQECYAKFNACTHNHFKDTPWNIKNDYKQNVVRVWQKINEYQGESSKWKRALNLV